MPTTTELRETIARYATVISARDADAYAAQFTPDAVQVDPYPTPPNVGRDAIRAFIQRSYDACEAMQFEVESLHPVADKAAIEFPHHREPGRGRHHAHPGHRDLHRYR